MAKSLEIKTKSIETTLVPLVTQISTLVNFKERTRTTNEKTLQAIIRVGEAVHMAVERFVSVGKNKQLAKRLNTILFCYLKVSRLQMKMPKSKQI